MNAKEVFESVLTVPTVKKLWTANYQPAIPFTPQDFAILGVLPAIMYMFRWGHRRGKSKFFEKYGQIKNDQKGPPTVDSITEVLNKQNEFIGFTASVSKAILGDMLLSTCLENKHHQTGRIEQVQRAYPTHYMASWIDLPANSGWLRFIPELIVAILAQQEEGASIQRNSRRSHFSVGSGFENNILLSQFGNGMEISGTYLNDMTSDHFIENYDSVGIDQLLTIRVAQGCGEAPAKARGEDAGTIANQWPLSTAATKHFREDFSVFMQAYGTTIPRQTFLQMMESCISLGLTNLYFSTISILYGWERNGELPSIEQQKSWPLFVDCSTGNNRSLRLLAEESMSHFMRRIARLPMILMSMRIIDTKIRSDRQLRDSLPNSYPDATDFLNLLGSLYKENHPRSEKLLNSLDEACLQIADTLEENVIEQELQELLRGNGNPIDRLSESLCMLMGESNQYIQYIKVVNSTLMTDMPNGMAQKRKISKKSKTGKTAKFDVRSIVLTNPMLDFIVHRHLRKAAKGKGSKPLTFIDLLHILKCRYGLYVDESPPGMSIPVEMLLHNKRILERRLRD